MTKQTNSKKTGIIATTITVALLLTAGVTTYIVYQNNQNATKAASTQVPDPSSTSATGSKSDVITGAPEPIKVDDNKPSNSASNPIVPEPNTGEKVITEPVADPTKTGPTPVEPTPAAQTDDKEKEKPAETPEVKSVNVEVKELTAPKGLVMESTWINPPYYSIYQVDNVFKKPSKGFYIRLATKDKHKAPNADEFEVMGLWQDQVDKKKVRHEQVEYGGHTWNVIVRAPDANGLESEHMKLVAETFAKIAESGDKNQLLTDFLAGNNDEHMYWFASSGTLSHTVNTEILVYRDDSPTPAPEPQK